MQKKPASSSKRHFVSLDYPRGVYSATSKIGENRRAKEVPPNNSDATDHHWHERRPPPFPSLF